MANINETISEVAKLNPELARQIQKYVKDHSYGLVFEHNLPEAVRLYKKQPAVGDTVNILAPRGQKETEENSVPWCVKYIDNGIAYLEHDGEAKDVPLEDICVLVSYRDVIYPGLKEIDRVERGNPEDPYHMVINSENYHALEALTYAYAGNDTYAGDDRAAILWLSDSPSLNEQTMKRFDAATDLLNGAVSMEAISADFAKNHAKLSPGHIYFLNRQLLGKGKKLTNEAEGGRSFYDVLNATIEDDDIHLFLFIDEAHRGLGTGNDKGTSDNANKTIYSIIIDGQDGINKPMPCVVGISATPERFNNAMAGRKNRDMKASVDVPVSAVKDSGLIKDMIELRTPKKAADTKHQDLTQACVKLASASKLWKDYCEENKIPTVIPLMVVQVEDKVSVDTLTSLCSQIHKTLPWLDISDCFANVFGEHDDIVTPAGKIPYVKPEEVAERTEIRVLFAKDAVSTGWDCPRAEVIYSRRKRTDPTYIAQLIGRMVRTPLARRVTNVEELNTVAWKNC